jgi:hypothetical protein
MVTVLAVSCSYSTWYMQNACCTDFQTQRFLNDCLVAVGAITTCKILHTNAVALCLHFATPTCSCDWQLFAAVQETAHCQGIPSMKYTTHSPVFSKVCHSWTALLCHLWILVSSDPSYTKTVYTQLLPILTTFCIPTSQCNKVLAYSCGEGECSLHSWCRDGDVQEFSIFWLPVGIPSFECFVTGSYKFEWGKMAVSQLAPLSCHCAECVVLMCLSFSEVDCFHNSFRHLMYATLRYATKNCIYFIKINVHEFCAFLGLLSVLHWKWVLTFIILTWWL